MPRYLFICILCLFPACKPAGKTHSPPFVDFTEPQITTRFGMTFCLVAVDPNAPKHTANSSDVAYPEKSYYLQQRELTQSQFNAHLSLAKQLSPQGSLVTYFPSEWRDVEKLARELSKIDPDYDYRLPSREEWCFACMNGYDQDCPGTGAESMIDKRGSTPSRPNKYGIQGFMNYDAECSNQPGLFLGKYDYWEVRKNGGKLDCQCHQFVYGNPDADDGLNEIIVGRYVLMPKVHK